MKEGNPCPLPPPNQASMRRDGHRFLYNCGGGKKSANISGD